MMVFNHRLDSVTLESFPTLIPLFYLVPTPLPWAEMPPLDKVAQSPVQSGLKHFQLYIIPQLAQSILFTAAHIFCLLLWASEKLKVYWSEKQAESMQSSGLQRQRSSLLK